MENTQKLTLGEKKANEKYYLHYSPKSGLFHYSDKKLSDSNYSAGWLDVAGEAISEIQLDLFTYYVV